MRQAVRMLAVVVMGAALGCHGGQGRLTDADRALLARAGLPEAFGAALKRIGRNLRQLEARDGEGQPLKITGVTLDVPQDRAKRAVRELRGETPPGFAVFVSDQNFGIGGTPDRVSVMAAQTLHDVVAAVGTAGWNYDLGPEAVAKRLREWDTRYGLLLVGAGDDWFEAEFVRRPTDMPGFAREVYDFCPDVVDQGTGTVEALGAEMERENVVYLWWD